MKNRKGQANIIAMVGMIAATIFVMLNAFTYINTVGLSSTITITAQSSIYQSLAVKDYLIQQAHYLFDKAQLFDAFTLNPTMSTLNCGYINTTTRLPFIPVDKVYYWHNLEGQTCLPNNQEILYGLTQLLNQSQFSFVNSSGLNVQSFLDLNFTKTGNRGVFEATFSAPYLGDRYEFLYNRSNSTGAIFQVYDLGKVNCNLENSCPVPIQIFSGPTGSLFALNESQFILFPESDIVTGVLSQPTIRSAFFQGTIGSLTASSSQFTVITLQDGLSAIVFDAQSLQGGKTVTQFFLVPLANPNLYTLSAAIAADNAAGVPSMITLVNNSVFSFAGTEYNFTVTNYPNGVFNIIPENYAIVPLQPQFVYYKYIINQFDLSSGQNLLFSNYQPLRVSVSLFPLYNPEVCLSYNELQFTLQNCLSVSGYVTTSDYLSQLMQTGVAFVNESFPLGNRNITGFAQYALYNYLNNVVHGVNLKTVSVNGQPKYDWYSALLLSMGSIEHGTSYIINKLSRVAQPYYGTVIYNCSINSSDMQYCRTLLSQTLEEDLKNLLDYQVPAEVSFLSGTPFNVNVLNLSVSAQEASSCNNYANYNATVNYTYSFSPQRFSNISSETLGLPISLNFGYQNNLSLAPTESCGIKNNPYVDGFPGFVQTLASPSATYFNCAPVLAKNFLNTTCITSVQFDSSSKNIDSVALVSQINSQGGTCKQISNSNNIFCSGIRINLMTQPSFYQRWLTASNNCPNYALINASGVSYNFTYSNSQSTSKYVAIPNGLISSSGGGINSVKDSPQNWTFVSINSTNLNLPDNFSIYAGVVQTGPSSSFNFVMSTYPTIGHIDTIFQLNNGNYPNVVYNYNGGAGTLNELAASRNSASAGSENNLQINRYGTSASGYNFTFTLNSVLQSTINYSSAISGTVFNNPVNLLALSTDDKPTSDYIDYLFVTNYIRGYNPVNMILPYQSAASLNPSLSKSFGLLSNTNNAYYNVILLNPIHSNSAYQLKLKLDSNFNYNSFFSAPYIEIFAVNASSDNSELLSWWNQTTIQQGGIIWVNIGKTAPSAIYVVYGPAAYDISPHSDSGKSVFPYFFSNSSLNWPFNFNYSQSKSNRIIQRSHPLDLIRTGPLAPYVYNSTLTQYYAQFACVTVKTPQGNPELNIQMLNATYSPYAPQFNINQLYGEYNLAYPNFQVITSASNCANSWNCWSG